MIHDNRHMLSDVPKGMSSKGFSQSYHVNLVRNIILHFRKSIKFFKFIIFRRTAQTYEA